MLGVVCLATVAGFVTHVICFCVVLLGMIVTDRALIRRVDWELLLTFVCFFLFSGNLQQIEPVRNLMMQGLSGGVCLTAALVSQVISNVPAAVLLSGFTEQGKELLLVVDIGGLNADCFFGEPDCLSILCKIEASESCKVSAILFHLSVYRIVFFACDEIYDIIKKSRSLLKGAGKSYPIKNYVCRTYSVTM